MILVGSRQLLTEGRKRKKNMLEYWNKKYWNAGMLEESKE